MAENTGIAWTKSTFNPWIGCTKVGPGCDNCYAETMDKRSVFKGVQHWGAGVSRMRTSDANWNKVRQWNKQAPNTEFAGRKGFWPVFCASLADVFDNEVPVQWRRDLFDLIELTPNLTWLLLTKRIGNVFAMVSEARSHDWLAGRNNVWLGATVVNQEEADRDIPKLLKIPAKVRFLSIEPMLGTIDLAKYFAPLCDAGSIQHPHLNAGTTCPFCQGTTVKGGCQSLHWVIVGGESGSKARPMRPEWVCSMRDQCAASGVPFFFKQWGEFAPNWLNDEYGEILVDTLWIDRMGKKAAGDSLYGEQHHNFPVVI